MKQCGYTKNDVEIVKKTRDFDGYFQIDTYRLRHKTFAGSWSDIVRREIFERGHAVAVLPYDPVTDRIVLIEQFRLGALAALDSPHQDKTRSPWLLEVVAGIIDEGDMPEDVARREMVEESGLEVHDLLPMLDFFVTPGGSSETIVLFLGRVDASNVAGVHGLDHEGEDIRPFSVPLEEAYAGIADGRVCNATAIVAIQWLMLNKADVLTKWT